MVMVPGFREKLMFPAGVWKTFVKLHRAWRVGAFQKGPMGYPPAIQHMVAFKKSLAIHEWFWLNPWNLWAVTPWASGYFSIRSRIWCSKWDQAIEFKVKEDGWILSKINGAKKGESWNQDIRMLASDPLGFIMFYPCGWQAFLGVQTLPLSKGDYWMEVGVGTACAT